MQRGAEAVHAANPRVLVILSGLNNDNDLSFLHRRPVHLSFSHKVAFEVHWYSFSDPHQWTGGNANRVCARVAASVVRRTLYLLARGWPVFLSEFGVDNRGSNVADNRYWGCVAAAAAGLDLDWALWALQGSYYLREGVVGHDEAYGVLDHAWLWARNDTALRRLRALQRPFRGPGLAESPPYKVLFHPVTGLCVVRRPLMPGALPLDLALPVQTLELGPCNETEAWEYNREHRLVLRDTLLRLCLRAEGVGRPVRLGLGRAGCAGAQARWLLESDSKLHVAVHVPPSSARSEMLCLDVGADGRSIVTNRCRCLSGGGSGCDPESQWFKLVSSTRKVANNSILPQLLLSVLKYLEVLLFSLF
ncbi:hypothetical protein C2845_PM16G04150 [Panicum miliaceum]|uniref:Glycoside hydrolase family 5 domain-containing protein n=1 Tax=Panicum miliaceum TaxID=4540 RepID=A0A3L6PZ97_PANMI|nr:hypothetical protein C2845_PM16G04150 [Panicum miliaceum]